MPAEETYVGFGERTGLLDKRGQRLTNWCTDRWEYQGPGVDELYLAIPVYLGVAPTGRCHGVYLHNTYRSAFDLTDERGGKLIMEVEGGELDWYVLAGPTPADVVRRYTALTGRMPLIGAWLAAFTDQAIIRSTVNGTPVAAALLPMTGFAFVLFTFYMITAPGTTPSWPRGQAVFAAAVAVAYGVLMELHIVFGLFYALTIVTALRGLLLQTRFQIALARQTERLATHSTTGIPIERELV
jgi:hypothetical protein